MNSFKEYLLQAASGTPLSQSAMAQAMNQLLTGDVSDTEAAAFLAALKVRGETIDEIVAAAETMRAPAVPVECPRDVVDTCGTGGDGANTFNISTAAAIIAAGAGVKIAKHGNKAASSKSGSSDVLSELGINLKANPNVISECIEDAGIGFLFAAYHHKAVANVASVRKKLGTRTLFNLLGPLTNPAGAKRHLMGVFAPTLMEPMAGALLKMGATKAWVVHGADGLDEISISGETHVSEVNDDSIRTFTITPEDAGLKRHPINEIRGGDPVENAAALNNILSGEKNAYREIAVLNAAAAILIADKAENLQDAARKAETSIDSGRARLALENLIKISNQSAI